MESEQKPLPSKFTRHRFTRSGIMGSFCPACSLYIAFSQHLRFLATAERAHHCVVNPASKIPKKP